ncbi:hypothetical protein I551_3950 [Mycobacterium ulcerans str. Harvey]|uniref:Uncharacterized protein n=1 Tax=Mycobacterium ulcerans str. Harvey TaxID=1299332 RepID=A0ABP3AIK1_MYCUL|nr:hypothetical protein I551_3950 [Mycobacterium ulcerans str. Harvey]
MVERGAEPILDLGAHLGAKAQDESAAAEQLVVIGLMGQVYRIAWKSDRHVGHQIQAAYRGGEGQWSEYVVWALKGGYPTRTGVPQLPRPLGGVG